MHLRNPREILTVLAALRMWQRAGMGHGVSQRLSVQNSATITPLEAHHIDELTQRLKAALEGGPGKAHVPLSDQGQGMGA